MQAFLDSFGIVLITAVACCIAFTVTCFPAGYVAFAAQSSVGIFVAFGIGFLCAGWVLWRLARRIWPIRDD
jgi:hypothetical protein